VARSRVERSEFYSARPSGEPARGESIAPGRVEPALKDALKDT
jgi:hypothetical protein